MAAYAALVSLMHIIDDLENHPRPPLSLPKQQVDSLTSKVTFLQEFLEGYNPHLDYTTEADPLEIRIADAAYAAEDIIESHIVDEITNDGNKMSSDGVYQALEKVIEEMEVIKKEAMEIKHTTFGGVNHQLHTKSTPPDSSKSSSSTAQLQQSRMVGADDAILEMKDKLTSDRLADLQVIPIVGMGGSGKTTLARNLYQDRLINEQLQGDNTVLGNLQTLGEVVNFKCRIEIVKRIPNIKELKLVYEDGVDDDDNTVDDDDDDMYCFKNIVCLDKLESLSCTFRQREHPPPSLINFPHSLKELELCISESECWNDVLDKIGALPLVQQLTLVYGRFKEGQWETSEGQFRSLKLLDLAGCEGLQVWKTECSHFPCLEYLRLDGIHDLEEIPLDLAEISTFKGIVLYDCSDSAVVSAKRIVEEQEELYGVEASLQVVVTLDMKNNEAPESLASANFRVATFEE